MTQREERFQIDINATAAEVWERLTTAEGLASWLGTRAGIDLQVGGGRTVGWGDEVEIVAEIADIDPERRLRVVYMVDGEEVGAEEWLISTQGATTRLTLINSMSDLGVDDWEGFYGDIRRGWQLFLESMRFALESARTPNREVDCIYVPATGSREAAFDRIAAILDGSPVIDGMGSLLAIPPHARLLGAEDRTLLFDLEGSGDTQVLYAQAATHDGPGKWRAEALDLLRTVLAGGG